MKLTSAETLSQFETIEACIRNGQSGLAEKKLEKVPMANLPKPMKAKFASLARRCGRWDLGLKVLRPLVYPKVQKGPSGSVQERIEYAACLRRAGAIAESKKLLQSENVVTQLEALVETGFCYMTQWDYSKAHAIFQQCLQMPGASEYQNLVLRLNQLACLCYLDVSEFELEFDALVADLDRTQHALLWANAHELLTLYLIEQDRYRLARDRLRSAFEILSLEQGPYALFVRKCERVVTALEGSDPEGLIQFRSEVLREKDWESLRHLDYFVTKIQPESIWANRVYYGTPFEHLRRKLERFRTFAPDDYIRGGQKAEKHLDPWFALPDEGDVAHRALNLLLTDLYRPWSLGSLFSSLYPGEYFDIESSPSRLRQALATLRLAMVQQELPLKLVSQAGLHAVRLEVSTLLKVRKRNISFERLEFIFNRYAGVNPEYLSSAAWSQRLGLSQRRTTQLLRDGLDKQILVKRGTARYTEYAVSRDSQAS